MTKLAKSASNYSQLGTFAPVWDVFKTSTEKLANCHLDLVRKLQELIKEVQKYGEEQVKSHKKTKEEVAGTLEAVQAIQNITQALQKSKENYNSKCVEQERLKKEGATQREIEKAAVKSKKATDTYKLYVEKYALAKTDFEQKMTETAQKFQDIEETHLIHIKEIIGSLSNAIKEIHLQIGQVHEEFINNMANTTIESLIQKFAESKGTGKERPGLIEFEECDPASAVEGIKPRKRKTFALPGIIKKEKDAESVCIVKITGDVTISFPSGIIKVFTSNPSPAVLCFRVKNISRLEQILPNSQLVFSDPSQCDSNTKDFWMNMQAVTVYLKKLSEQNPAASYYNVDVLKYQVSSNGIQSTPLNLATYWKCSASTTDLRVDYKYNPEAMVAPSVLSNIQVVVPVDGGVTNMQSLPPAIWNAEQMKAFWKLSGISEKSESGGKGVLLLVLCAGDQSQALVGAFWASTV
ncbi:FCH domain only protein 2 [Cricetulus griseus]|uniref:FCH domain only protein 2 n=1 Tax=Cricetulus griseus TaxID=10029 RepID=G3HIU3_CRIGR|nr:FCH domain only protein 2 [Cricetulus griseus]